MEKRNWKNEKEEMNRELGRQLVHASIGIFLILFLALFGREYLMFLLAVVLLAGTFLINWKMLGSRIGVADWFEERFERDTARFPGYGSAWYIAGALLIAVFLHDYKEIAAAVWMVGIGDAASTIIGMRGKNRIFYNNTKTWEGSAAFFISSIPTYFFIGWLAVPLSVIAAAAESLPLPYDDNIVIPAVCVLFFAVI